MYPLKIDHLIVECDEHSFVEGVELAVIRGCCKLPDGRVVTVMADRDPFPSCWDAEAADAVRRQEIRGIVDALLTKILGQ